MDRIPRARNSSGPSLHRTVEVSRDPRCQAPIPAPHSGWPLPLATMPWRLAFTILAEVRVGSSSVLLPRALHSQPPGDYSTRLGWPQPRHCSALLCSLKALLGFFPRPPGSVHELAWPPRGRSSWAGSSAVSGSWPRCCCGRAARRRSGARAAGGGHRRCAARRRGDRGELRVRDIGLVAAGQVRLRHLRLGPRRPAQPGE